MNYLSHLRHAINENGVGITGTAFSWLGVITAQQEQLEFWLKMTSYLGAITVSALTAYRLLNPKK